jgi:LmbE family N-acetylglucosaminyl deacetylase
MRAVTILSPHLDDAAFSLCLTLRVWAQQNVVLNVLNFFTLSAYAPRASTTEVEAITRIRRAEDEAVLSSISPEICVESLELLDAPLRLGIDLQQIINPQSASLIAEEDVSTVRSAIAARTAGHFVLAPLGLGDHLDHLVVHRSALEAVPPETLGFYEDLPYATWTQTAVRDRKLASAGRHLHSRYRPIVMKSPDAMALKQAIIAGYSSQIDPHEVQGIASFAATYGGGEQIWLPTDSSAWAELIAADVPAC